MKLIRNKYVILFIIALLSLLLGISFMFTSASGQTENAQAAYCVVRLNWKAHWINPDGRVGYGRYVNSKSSGAQSLDYNAGNITLTSIGYSGQKYFSYTGNTNKASSNHNNNLHYETRNNNSWFSSSSYSYRFSFSAYASPGFTLYSSGGLGTYENSGRLSFWRGNHVVTNNLYAYFIPNVYNVSWNTGNGVFADGSKEIVTKSYYLDYYDLPKQVPQRVGYTFKDWGGYNSKSIMTTYNNHVVYANWKPNEYKLTLNKNDGTNSSSVVTAYYDNIYPTVEKPVRAGYTFLGYFDSPVGGTQYYDKNGKGLFTYTTLGDSQLYAQWEPEEYYLTFNANGGTCDVERMFVSYGEEISFPIPTREGYHFQGWTHGGYKLKDFCAVPDLGDNEETINLIADWIIEEYYISFDAGGGNSTCDVLTTTYERNLNYSSDPLWPTATKAGNIFKGWQYDGVIYKTCYTVPDLGDYGQTVVFTAVWENEVYTIHFDANQGECAASQISVTFSNVYNDSTNPV